MSHYSNSLKNHGGDDDDDETNINELLFSFFVLGILTRKKKRLSVKSKRFFFWKREKSFKRKYKSEDNEILQLDNLKEKKYKYMWDKWLAKILLTQKKIYQRKSKYT